MQWALHGNAWSCMGAHGGIETIGSPIELYLAAFIQIDRLHEGYNS